jgi:hypothetical protein
VTLYREALYQGLALDHKQVLKYIVRFFYILIIINTDTLLEFKAKFGKLNTLEFCDLLKDTTQGMDDHTA